MRLFQRHLDFPLAIMLFLVYLSLSGCSSSPTEVETDTLQENNISSSISSSISISATSSSSEATQNNSQDTLTSYCEPYDRSLYKHWVDADSDCQDTRQEVLNEENLLGQTDDCSITNGQWYDPFSDSTFTDPSLLDIDHLIPLAEAHRSGGYAWTSDEREAFANDLENQDALIAVWLSQNRSKSDRDPSEWLPKNESYHQEYAVKWSSIKVKYGLSADTAELRVLRELVGADSTKLGVVFPNEAEEVECTGSDITLSSMSMVSSSSESEFGECGSKTTCGEMTSCDEAIFFLEQCGVNRLDGDGDGTPCETVCG